MTRSSGTVSRTLVGKSALALVLSALLAEAPAQGLVNSTATVLVPLLPPSYYPGAAWGDVDGDGWQDLYVTNYYGPNHLFLNRPGPAGGPPRQLLDATPPVLMDPAGHGEGAVFADFDNDGDPDLHVVNAGGTPNRLFANLGGGAWADVSAGSGLDHPGIGEGCAVADFDGDGDLDVYLLNYGSTSSGEIDVFFANIGGLVFVPASPATLLMGPAPGGACAFADYDNDGDPDLFVGNDGTANRLLENRGGGAWADVTMAVGGATLRDAAGGCFGVRWIDHDNDGDLDLYLSNSATFHGTSSANKLFRNDIGPLGTRVLTLIPSGAEDPGSGMAVTGGDLDRDGREDLAMANFGPNRVYLQGMPGSLLPYAMAPASWFLDPIADTSSSATRCDFDRDGDLDLFFGGTFFFVFENLGSSATTATPGHSLSVRFVGDRAAPFEVPRDGHGTRARLVLGGGMSGSAPTRSLQQVDGGSGYAQDAPECFWSVPGSRGYTVERLAITWANGRTESLPGLPTPDAAAPNRRLTVHYPAGISSYGVVSLGSFVPLVRSSTTDEFTPATVGASNFALAATGLPDGSFALLVLGFAPASIPTPVGTLLVDPLVSIGAFAAGGMVKWPLPIPADPFWIGTTIHGQCFAGEPAGTVRVSLGLAIVVQP